MTFVVLLTGIGFVVVLITRLKLHPFLALLLAAILVGVISPAPITSEHEIKSELQQKVLEFELQLEEGLISKETFIKSRQELAWLLQDQWLKEQGKTGGQLALSIEIVAQDFGKTVGAIGLVIVLAAIIGQCLLESGAADKIMRKLLATLGEKRSAEALLGSGYFLAIPVFFDTVFFLLVPLARALRLRTGKNYTLYIMAICAGAAITHSLVPPTPGPLVMTETLPGLGLGISIVVGFLLGIIPAVAGGLIFSRLVNYKMQIPLRNAPGSSLEELEEIMQRSEDKLPRLFWSVVPVVLPVALIAGNTIIQHLGQATILSLPSDFLQWLALLGNKNCAMFLAAGCAMWLLMRQKELTLAQLGQRLEPSISSAGLIILITSAGGSFGSMLARTGISGTLRDTVGEETFFSTGVLVILLGWGLAVIMKSAQGSGTVAMITASSIMAAILQDAVLPFHIVYVFAAIGFGSLLISWMNDSGFWVVCKLGGFTERETFSTWSLMLVCMGTIGLLEVLLLSALLPLV